MGFGTPLTLFVSLDVLRDCEVKLLHFGRERTFWDVSKLFPQRASQGGIGNLYLVNSSRWHRMLNERTWEMEGDVFTLR